MSNGQNQSQHAFDEQALLGYLKANSDIRSESIGILRCEGGNSNLTYELLLDDLRLILRTPPSGRDARAGHDMSREFTILSAIASEFPAAPKPILFCSEEDVIGNEFLVMEKIEGPIIRMDVMPSLSSSRELRKGLLDSFTETLARLHSLGFQQLGLTDLWKGSGYVARQVDTWTSAYSKVKSQDVEEMEIASEWFKNNTPEDSGRCLIHNDFKLDNLVLDAGNPSVVRGVLDWEMATIGDPLMDLGMTLAYWIPADSAERLRNLPFNPRVLMDEFHRDAIIEKYAEHSGRRISDIDFHHAFGLFKAATIAQTIYSHASSTPNLREYFSFFPSYVDELAKLALGIIETRR